MEALLWMGVIGFGLAFGAIAVGAVNGNAERRRRDKLGCRCVGVDCRCGKAQ